MLATTDWMTAEDLARFRQAQAAIRSREERYRDEENRRRYKRYAKTFDEIEERMTSAATYREAATALNTVSEHVRQLVLQGNLPLVRTRSGLIGGPEIVDPGVMVSASGLEVLRRVPAGRFSANALRLPAKGVEELRGAGILVRIKRAGRTTYELTALGQWTASCLNIVPIPAVPDQLPGPPAGCLRHHREYILALAEAAGDSGITANLVNMAAGNRDLPSNAKLEMVVIALAKSGYLRRQVVAGRKITYAIAPRGLEWLHESGVRVEGLEALATGLHRARRRPKGDGLPNGLFPVTVESGGVRRTPLQHMAQHD